MAQELKQEQKLTQTQTLSTMQVALASLVELPLMDFTERIKNELLDNAALEEDDHHQDDDLETFGGDDDWSGEGDSQLSDTLSDYANEDDIPSYLQERADTETERREVPLVGDTSPFDDLTKQIGEHDLTDEERQVMEYLIGSLDDDGFLRKDLDALVDELAIYHNIYTDRAQLEHLLHILQTFEPSGIGARSLQECLRLQILDDSSPAPYKKQALRVVDRYFKDFTARRWDVIADKLSLPPDEMESVRHYLTHLNPRPGRQLGSGASASAQTIIPDFFVDCDKDGHITLTLNMGDVPRLHLSAAFTDSIKQYAKMRDKLTRSQRDAYTYARQKVESAQTFISLVERRQQTLRAVMGAIVDFQRSFFVEEDDESQLRPLTLKDVAGKAGVDISTVSRAANSKYVQTAYGVYPLKYFFSSQFTTEDGDALSARKVRAALKRIVDAEDKRHPLADEALAKRLQEEGLPVARRTVAKYREQLGILSARLRRE